VADALATLWGLEGIAVALGIAYVVLAARENALCWVAGFGSTALYVRLFWDASLVMESALQVFYLVVSVVGLVGWQATDRPIQRWSWPRHAIAWTVIAVLTILSGTLLTDTDAALPYADSFTTWASVVTTLMVTQKVLSNWLYWLVINVVGIYLYWSRGLYVTAGLYVVYEIVAVFGWFEWRRRYRAAR
jgi:nicotinamide mononucleotide transporter